MNCRYVSLLALLSIPVACSIALKTDEKQCSTDADCAQRGGAMANAVCRDEVCVEENGVPSTGSDWACLGKVSWPTPTKPQVVVTMQFIDLIAKAPVTSVNIHACAKMDVTCANPLGPNVSPDAQGMAAITIPASFDGYVEVLSADPNPDGSGLVPLNVFFNPPPADDSHFGTVPTITGQGLRALASAHGNTVDPSLGFLFSGALDCNGKPAPGVSWEPDRVAESTRRFYYVDGLPSEAAIATDASGYGGLINMPTGTIRVHAKIQATGQPVGSASVFVRAGYITTGFLVPTP